MASSVGPRCRGGLGILQRAGRAEIVAGRFVQLGLAVRFSHKTQGRFAPHIAGNGCLHVILRCLPVSLRRSFL